MFGTFTGPRGYLFEDLSRLQRELDEAFGRWPLTAELRSPTLGSWPPINIGATPERVDVYLFAPGLDPSGALTLPEDVDPDRVDASYRDGVLHVSVQRRESAQPRRISVA